jgi:hypothetical protein
MINGFTSPASPIKCSIGQGSPLSMLLFTLKINPVLHTLDQHIHGYQFEEESPEIT